MNKHTRRGLFKKIITLVTIIGLGLGLSGCSGRGSDNQQQSYTLYLWRPLDAANEEVFQEIINDFENDYENIQIELVSKHPQNYEEEILSALAAHQTVSNAPDIIMLDADKLPGYVPQLAAAPSDLFDRFVSENKRTGKPAIETVAEIYEPIVPQSNILNDASGQAKLYALPLSMDNLSLYINTKLVEEAVDRVESDSKYTKDKSREELKEIVKKIETPPETWADLAEIIPYLTVRDGENITRSAIAMGTSLNVERSYDILSTIMMQNGTQMTSSQFSEATFNLSQPGATTEVSPGEEALKFYLRFSNPNDPLYTWSDKMSNSVDAFLQGQVAMIIHNAASFVYMVNDNPSMKSDIEVSPIPQITTADSATAKNRAVMGMNQVLAAPSAKGDAGRQLAAWNFIRFASSRKGASPYLSAVKQPSALKDLDSKAKFEAFDNQRDISKMWFKGHKPLQVDEIFISMIDDAYSGRKSVKDALAAAAADATDILQSTKNKWVSQ